MKRLFTLLSLLLLVVGTGMAQDVPTAGKTYVIQVVKNAGTAMSTPNLVLTTGTDKYIRAQALSTLTTALITRADVVPLQIIGGGGDLEGKGYCSIRSAQCLVITEGGDGDLI